jgi:AraC-like DNA-binding protein
MQTLPNHFLTLKLRRLQPSEEWCPGGNGLSFALVKGGRGHYGLGTSPWKIITGDVLVLNPEAKGKLTAQKGELLFWEFTSRLEHLLPLFSAEEICMLQDIWENFRRSKLYPASTPMAKQCHALAESAPPPGSLDHRSHVLRVAAAILTLEFLNSRTQWNASMPVQDHLTRVFEELSATELLTLSIEDLAKKFRCSRRHLSRLFHQQFGCSVATLRMELRLLKAVSLLRDPGAKVITVAEQCGFNHLGLFNTCFKRRFGQSPGQWRKTATANVVESSLGTEGRRLATYRSSARVLAKASAGASVMQAEGHQTLREMCSDGIEKLCAPSNANPRAIMTQ